MDSAEQENCMKQIQAWPCTEQVDLMKRLLGKMTHHQLSLINTALQPLLQRDFITLLPLKGLTHLSVKILSCLDAKSLYNASCACKEWNRIIHENHLWKKLIENNIREHKVWADIVKRRGWDKWLTLPNADKLEPSLYTKIYFNIISDIKDLDRRWREGSYTEQQIFCNSETSRGVYCVQYDDNKIVSGLRDNVIKVWDRKTLECTRTFKGHTGSVLCLQYDNSVIVSGSSDSTIRLWDINGEENAPPLNTIEQHTEAVLHLKFNKNIMVTCSKDKTIIVWEIISAKNVQVRQILVGHKAAVNVVDFDEKYIVSASGDRTIKVWSLGTYEFVKTLSGHRRGIACLQYRNKLIVSGSSDNSIKIWEIESGTCLRTLEGHKDLVRCIRFDRRRIVSGSYDGQMKVWDLEAALDEEYPNALLCLMTLHKHGGRVFRLQFDDVQIVSSSHDDSIIIWDFLNPEPVNQIPIVNPMSDSMTSNAVIPMTITTPTSKLTSRTGHGNFDISA